MNPFEKYKTGYITACFTTAVIYAFCIGNQLLVSRLADGLIYGCLLCFTGIIFWYIFRFAIPKSYISIYQFIFLISLILLTSLFIVGTETLAMYICFPSTFILYTTTIPARIFVTYLLFIIMRLCYIAYVDKQQIEDNDSCQEQQPIPAPVQSTDRITVRSGQKIKLIPVCEIIYIQAEGDYISIHTSEGKWLKEQTMKYTETILPPKNFIRVHRSYIINISYISRIERYGERQQIVLHNQEKIKISAARYQSLKQLLSI